MKYKATPTKLPKLLAAMRREAGLSQKQVAALLGYNSASTVSHYENGKREIPLNAISKFSRLYGYQFELRFTKGE